MNEWINKLDEKEKKKAELLLASMKSGKFILLLGSFCPLFWMSLLAKHSPSVILFNLGHSVLYILIGYMMMKKAKTSLEAMKKKG